MNIVIGLVIVLCLMVSEMTATVPVDDVWRRVIVMLLTMMVVPGLAVFQVFVFKGRMQQQSIALDQHQSIIRRISACHSAVWLAASLAIVWAVQWQNVVRGNWGLDSWPLLDEFVIILPIVLSLVASWAVFYEIQKSLRADTKTTWRDRFKYVSLRFRIYVAIVVVPIALMVLMRDLGQGIDSLTTTKAVLLTVVTFAGLLAVFPFAMLLVWGNRNFKNPDAKTRLLYICRQHKMRVTHIRIWNTGNQIINAVVAGVFPYFRVLMLSDALMQSFPQNELEAIVKHEAGHIRMGHLPIRIIFVLLPILALAFVELFFDTTLGESSSLIETLNSGTTGIDMSGAIAYVLFVVVVVAWLSKNMEHEADLYAIGAFDESNRLINTPEERENVQLTASQLMADALLRFAHINPDQYHRRSLTHPSLKQRIDMIMQSAASAEYAIEFRKRFVCRQVVLGCLVLFGLPILMLMFRFIAI